MREARQEEVNEVSELSVEPASLVERLHSFFHVELPADPELAGQYNLDPSGTLAEHFTDLTPADLDDAIRLASDNTTASYADFGGDSSPQLDGESPYAYAFRANYQPAGAEGDPGLDGLDSGFDDGIGHELPTALDGEHDFGVGLDAHPDAVASDQADTDPGSDTGDTGGSGDGLPDHGPDIGDPGDLPSHDVGDFHELGPDAGTGDAGDQDWHADGHQDPSLDADDGQFDPGLHG